MAVWAWQRSVPDRLPAEGGLRLICLDVRLSAGTIQELAVGSILLDEKLSFP